MDETYYDDEKPRSFVYILPISNTDNTKNKISSTLRNRRTIDEIAKNTIYSDGHYNIKEIISGTNMIIGDYIEEDSLSINCYRDRSRRYINDIIVISDLSNRISWTDLEGSHKYYYISKFNFLRREG